MMLPEVGDEVADRDGGELPMGTRPMGVLGKFAQMIGGVAWGGDRANHRLGLGLGCRTTAPARPASGGFHESPDCRCLVAAGGEG